jgi:hypothetical protein
MITYFAGNKPPEVITASPTGILLVADGWPYIHSISVVLLCGEWHHQLHRLPIVKCWPAYTMGIQISIDVNINPV